MSATITSTPMDGNPVRILGVVGSVRRESLNRRLLEGAARHVPNGATVAFWDGLAEIPPFDADREEDPGQAVVAFREAIAAADALLIATPEYNGSLPGQLKNALDWASRPFPDCALRGKPVAVIGASPSPGGTAHANEDARRILTRIGARVIEPRVLVSHAHTQIQPDGSFSDGELAAGLDALGVALVDEVRAGPSGVVAA